MSVEDTLFQGGSMAVTVWHCNKDWDTSALRWVVVEDSNIATPSRIRYPVDGLIAFYGMDHAGWERFHEVWCYLWK